MYQKSVIIENLWYSDVANDNYIFWLPREIMKEIFSIIPNFYKQNIDKPWYWGVGGLSRNPAITPEFVTENIYINLGIGE